MCEYTYTLTAEEIRRALWAVRRPPVKGAVQTGLLALLSVSAWVAYFRGDRSGGTLLMGIALPLLTAGVWVIPALSFRREAAAAAPLTVTLFLSEEAIGVGDKRVPLSQAVFIAAGDTVIWRPDRYQIIAVPRRALPPEIWEMLEDAARG